LHTKNQNNQNIINKYNKSQPYAKLCTQKAKKYAKQKIKTHKAMSNYLQHCYRSVVGLIP